MKIGVARATLCHTLATPLLLIANSSALPLIFAASLAMLNCIAVDYPRFRDQISEDGVLTSVDVGYPGRFLATAYIFGYHGVITEWAAYTVHNGSHPVELHVWQLKLMSYSLTQAS